MWIDIAAVAFLAVFGILGYARGLFSQAWSLGALVVSFFSAEPVLHYLQTRLGTGQGEAWLGEWILTLVVGAIIYVALLAIGYLLEKSVIERFKLLSHSNRFLGFTLGSIKGAVGVVLSVWILSFLSPVWGTAQAAKEKVMARGTVASSTTERGGSAAGATSGATSTGKAGAAADDTTGSPEAPRTSLQQQLATSRVVAAVDPYNPLNLLLLAKVKPYLPPSLTGSSRPAVKPPSAVERNATYQSLLTDTRFLEAYRDRKYLAMIRNPTFHRFVQDKSLLDALEESKH